MKPGFVLLEILIAIALGAIIAASLFTTLFQINRAVKMSEQVVQYDARAVLALYQLERDMLGVFVPYEFVSQKETTTTEKTTEVKPKAPQVPGAIQQTEITKKETEKKEEPVEKSFYADMQEGSFKQLTFITSNPLPAYDSIKPRIARVTYHLVPEQQRQNAPVSYRLLREESLTLKPEQERGEGAKGAELARGIKSLKFEFKCRPPQKKEEKPKEGQAQQGKQAEPVQLDKKKQEKPPLEKFQVWGKEQIEKVKHLVPQEIEITLTLWDSMRKKEHTFERAIMLLVDEPVQDKEKSKAQGEQKSAQEKNERDQGGVDQQATTGVETSTLLSQMSFADQALMVDQLARELRAPQLPSPQQLSMLEGVPQ